MSTVSENFKKWFHVLFRTPDLGYDWKSNSGRPFNYFCFGAACSEVEVDCLTGDHQVLYSVQNSVTSSHLKGSVTSSRARSRYCHLITFTLSERPVTHCHAILKCHVCDSQKSGLVLNHFILGRPFHLQPCPQMYFFLSHLDYSKLS